MPQLQFGVPVGYCLSVVYSDNLHIMIVQRKETKETKKDKTTKKQNNRATKRQLVLSGLTIINKAINTRAKSNLLFVLLLLFHHLVHVLCLLLHLLLFVDLFLFNLFSLLFFVCCFSLFFLFFFLLAAVHAHLTCHVHTCLIICFRISVVSSHINLSYPQQAKVWISFQFMIH